jgi:hypothetical protein
LGLHFKAGMIVKTSGFLTKTRVAEYTLKNGPETNAGLKVLVHSLEIFRV